jgi:hypothetical protein
MSGQVANQRLVELTVHEEHGEFYEDGGDFLPLSVLTQQGFNATSIEENALPKDQRDHPVLGKTYRVNIIKGGFRGTKTVGKSDKLLAAGQMGGGASSGASSSGLQAGQTPPLALADLESSDASSSSSSSRHKRSKKTKKSKKDKKKKSKKDKQHRKRARSEEKASLSSNCCWGYIIIKRPCR